MSYYIMLIHQVREWTEPNRNLHGRTSDWCSGYYRRFAFQHWRDLVRIISSKYIIWFSIHRQFKIWNFCFMMFAHTVCFCLLLIALCFLLCVVWKTLGMCVANRMCFEFAVYFQMLWRIGCFRKTINGSERPRATICHSNASKKLRTLGIGKLLLAKWLKVL